MNKGLLSLALFCTFLLMSSSITAQNNGLETLLLKNNKQLTIVIVDDASFANQDVVKKDNYKQRHYNNITWFKNNWYTFTKSIRNKESYRVNLDADTYKALSSSQKNKLMDLYSSCYTGTFDPYGIAVSQMSKIRYNPKLKDNEQAYQKLRLSQEDIDNYIQNKNNVVLVINSNTAAQIGAILN